MVLVYLPTRLGDFVRANVGKYSTHGAYDWVLWNFWHFLSESLWEIFWDTWWDIWWDNMSCGYVIMGRSRYWYVICIYESMQRSTDCGRHHRRATMGNVGMDSSKKPPEMNVFCRNDGTSQRVKQTTPLSTTLSHLHVGSLTQPLTRHVHSLVTSHRLQRVSKSSPFFWNPTAKLQSSLVPY
jgi:hypothetical protein